VPWVSGIGDSRLPRRLNPDVRAPAYGTLLLPFAVLSRNLGNKESVLSSF